MKTVKSKTTYEVHGHEFADKDKAKAAEKLLDAKQAYEEARKRYEHLLAETFKTADGHQFRWCERYWWITSPFNAMPRKIDVWCFRSDAEVDLDEYADECSLSIKVGVDHWGNDRTRDPVKVPISDMYRDESKADATLYAAQISWLDEMRRQVENGSVNK